MPFIWNGALHFRAKYFQSNSFVRTFLIGNIVPHIFDTKHYDLVLADWPLAGTWHVIKELQEILGLSRAFIYELLKRREFRWVVVGGKYIISKPGFDEWFDGSTASGEAHAKLRFLKGDQDLGYKVISEYSWAKSREMGARLRRTAKILGFKRLTLSTSTGCRK